MGETNVERKIREWREVLEDEGLAHQILDDISNAIEADRGQPPEGAVRAEDARQVASYIVDWWPDLEDAIYWGGHEAYQTAKRILAATDRGENDG